MGRMRAIKRPIYLDLRPLFNLCVCETLLLICRCLDRTRSTPPVAVATPLHLLLIVRLSIVSRPGVVSSLLVPYIEA